MKFNDNKNELVKYITGEKDDQQEVQSSGCRPAARSQNTIVDIKMMIY